MVGTSTPNGSTPNPRIIQFPGIWSSIKNTERFAGSSGEAGGSPFHTATQERPWLAVSSRAAGDVIGVTPEVM